MSMASKSKDPASWRDSAASARGKAGGGVGFELDETGYKTRFSRQRRYTLAHYAALAMLSALLALLALSAPLAASSPLDAVADLAARGKHDKYHGKTLAPSNFTVVPGIFIQDDPKFNATGYDLLSDSFGLIDKSAKRWKNFTKWVWWGGPSAPLGLFHLRRSLTLSRAQVRHRPQQERRRAHHLQGRLHRSPRPGLPQRRRVVLRHPRVELLLGAPERRRQHDLGELTRPTLARLANTLQADAELTDLGIAQAQAANAGWKTQLKDNIPLPQRLYSSPMRRSASTLDITWKDILLNKGVKPVVSELEETKLTPRSRSTGASRSASTPATGATTRATLPLTTVSGGVIRGMIGADSRPAGFEFEPSFTEHDLLWDPIYEETGPQQAKRIRNALNQIFATDPSTFISITAHSGVINAFFLATGHNKFSVQTGGFVPVLVSGVWGVWGCGAGIPKCSRRQAAVEAHLASLLRLHLPTSTTLAYPR